MGNKDSKPTTSLADWQKIDTDNGIQIYRNKKNNQLAERRAITIDPHFDFNDQLKIYHMREHNRDALVRSFGTQNIDKKSNTQGLCSGHKKVYVMTQKMPYRLSQLPQLTFPQCLLILREALRAYSKIYKLNGPIHVTNHLIGINQFGQVKSWLNQNWALNHTDTDFPKLQSTKLQDLKRQQFLAYGVKYRDQMQMVHNIVAVVQQKCMEGKFPREFHEQVQNNSTSFKKLELYLQDFIHINQLFIPPKINYETIIKSKYQTRSKQQFNLSGDQQKRIKNTQQTLIQQQRRQDINQRTTNTNGQVVFQQKIQNQTNQINQPRFQQSQTYGYNYQNQPIFYQQRREVINGPVSQEKISYINSQQGNSMYGYQMKGENIGKNTVIVDQKINNNNLNYGGNSNSGYVTKKTIESYQNSNRNQPINSSIGSLYTLNNNYLLSNNVNNQTNNRIQKIGYSQTNISPIVQSKYQTSSYVHNVNTDGRNNPPISYLNSDNLNNDVVAKNYTFGGILGSNQVSSKYQVYNPSTYNTTTNYNAVKQGDISSVFNNQKLYSNNEFSIGNTNYQPNSAGKYSIQGYQGYQFDKNSSSYLNGNLQNKDSYLNNESNLNGGAKYITTTYTATKTFNNNGSNVGQSQLNNVNSAQKGSNYSFDGRQEFNHFNNNQSKYANSYSGTGYSNTLIKHDIVNTNLKNLRGGAYINLGGKYSQEFNNLISPALRGNLQQQSSNINVISNSRQKQRLQEGGRGSGYKVLTTQKNYSSTVKVQNGGDEQFSLNKSNLLQNIAKQVERMSNQVSETGTKTF